jgi:hypothetical protein
MNAARLYWAQLEGATKMFQTSEDKTQDGLDYIQNICCELINEFRCPRLVQIEARVGVLQIPAESRPCFEANSHTRIETALPMLSGYLLVRQIPTRSGP